MADWILVDLRDKNNSSSSIFSRAAFLLDNGNIVDLDGENNIQFPVPDDNYYLVIHHRNHLSVMSSQTLEISN